MHQPITLVKVEVQRCVCTRQKSLQPLREFSKALDNKLKSDCLSGNGNARRRHQLDADASPTDGSGERPAVHFERWKQNHRHRPGHRNPDLYG